MSKEITIVAKMQYTSILECRDDEAAEAVERELSRLRDDRTFDDVKILDMKYFVREKEGNNDV